MKPTVPAKGGANLENLFHQIATAPNGSVHRQLVRCGRLGCRCRQGARHVGHYFVWRDGTRQRKVYLPAAVAPLAAALCRARRIRQAQFRAELRLGQATWRHLTDHLRDFGG